MYFSPQIEKLASSNALQQHKTDYYNVLWGGDIVLGHCHWEVRDKTTLQESPTWRHGNLLNVNEELSIRKKRRQEGWTHPGRTRAMPGPLTEL